MWKTGFGMTEQCFGDSNLLMIGAVYHNPNKREIKNVPRLFHSLCSGSADRLINSVMVLCREGSA